MKIAMFKKVIWKGYKITSDQKILSKDSKKYTNSNYWIKTIKMSKSFLLFNKKKLHYKIITKTTKNIKIPILI